MSMDLDQLERLERLHTAGGLTDAEFASEKQRLLNPSDPDPNGGSSSDWRRVRIFLAAIFIIGAIAIAILLLMPAPERESDTVANVADDASSSTSDPMAAPWPAATPEVAADSQSADNATADAATVDGGYVEPKQVRGRCLLQVSGKKYIDGNCDIFLSQDGSFDIQDQASRPTYFAKVLRDGASARSYWNEEAGATHAHTDLGDLTRDGACWANQTTRICAWS